MDKNLHLQIAKRLNKKFHEWKTAKLEGDIKRSKDETTTRIYLIDYFFKLLGYDDLNGDIVHEYSAGGSKNEVKKVDMAIFIKGKGPLMFVECKKAKENLSHRNWEQLNRYCQVTDSVEVGILTNGIVYKFYTKKDDSPLLHSNPFFTLDLMNIQADSFDQLALFLLPNIEMKEIIKLANDTYYLESFDNALYKNLSEPSIDLIKGINTAMGFSVLNKNRGDKIRQYINSTSIGSALDRIIQDEVHSSNTGIITTEEEKKFGEIITTLLISSAKIKQENYDRIICQDLKTVFKVMVDGKAQKTICSLEILKTGYVMNIDKLRISPNLEGISAKEIIKHKKLLVDTAIKYL